MHSVTSRLLSAGVCLLMAGTAFAGQSGSSTDVDVNRLFRLSGAVAPRQGQADSTVESVQFAIYDQETGGTALWVETQTLTIDRNGAYSVLLGSSSVDGIPAELFASSDPRWLGVQVQRPGAVEQARSLLTSVPYAVNALRAKDADTLGGRPASDYALASSSGSSTSQSEGNHASKNSSPDTFSPQTAGTVGQIGKFVTGIDLGDSVMTESSGRIGVGTTSPSDFMHVRFTNTGGTMTGIAVQNLGATASSYSGMLFYDQAGALGQFQGFNNSTHEYRINNIASSGSINFMLASTSRFLVQAGTGNIGITETNPSYKLDVLHGGSTGIRSRSSASFSVVDIDGQTGDSALRFYKAGVSQWNIRNNPSTDDLQVFELGGGGERLRIENGTGNMVVSAAFTATGAKAFTIDHPLDSGKLLKHASAESNEVINFYSGNITTGADGKAVVQLPAYFEAINTDYRYQLTVIGAFAQAIVSAEVVNNQFEITTSLPNVKVSWEVKGIRSDAYMLAHPWESEVDKPATNAAPVVHVPSSID